LIVEKPFLCIQLVYACVYIGEAGSKRRWFWIKDGDLFKLPADSWKKLYTVFIYCIYVKWIYTVYIYTRTVTVLPQSLKCLIALHQISVWEGKQKTLGVSSSTVIDRGSFLCSQQHSWSSRSFFLLKEWKRKSQMNSGWMI